MFQYNHFWHFWFQLNNRHYLRAILASLVISVLLITAAVFFPPLWGLVAAFPLVVGGIIALFTQLSNFFYNRQNQQLEQLKAETADEVLKEEIDLYLNRRVVCPHELLAGNHLNLPHDTPKMKRAVANAPLILETEDILAVNKISNDVPLRNAGFKAMSKSNQLYVKNVAAKDALSEIAAREMAEILGFGGLIPSSTVAGTDVLRSHEEGSSISNAGLILSRQKIESLIDQENEATPEKNIRNSPGVQNAVTKFVFNLKMAAYRTRSQKEEQLKLLYVQKFIPDAVDGMKVYTQLFNEPVVLPGQYILDGLTEHQKKEQRAQAKKIVRSISLPSFQENFLLHLILGSQDAHPGNTLFTDASPNLVVLNSIDHERIMPEDNYNITKRIPLANGADLPVEKDIENVFPIRLWLAGLPQADVPFSKEVMKKAVESLNPERLLAYHQQKNLFSPAAVGAQLERILLIKNVFEEEVKKAKVTLTPKELFLKFVNNHPTYIFLKKELQLSDPHTFILLGQVPEGADMSLLRHPLQWFPMVGMALEIQKRARLGNPSFSEERFKSPYAHNLLFFSTAHIAKMNDGVNQAGLDILAETSTHLTSNI